MAERARRSRSAPSAPSAATAFEQLLESATALARSGAGEALTAVLREADRLLARERERFEHGGIPESGLRLMQQRLLEVRGILDTEQQRVGRELAALTLAAQADGRYAAIPPAAIALDRRG